MTARVSPGILDMVSALEQCGQLEPFLSWSVPLSSSIGQPPVGGWLPKSKRIAPWATLSMLFQIKSSCNIRWNSLGLVVDVCCKKVVPYSTKIRFGRRCALSR
jgi:hypothetical protein